MNQGKIKKSKADMYFIIGYMLILGMALISYLDTTNLTGYAVLGEVGETEINISLEEGIVFPENNKVYSVGETLYLNELSENVSYSITITKDNSTYVLDELEFTLHETGDYVINALLIYGNESERFIEEFHVVENITENITANITENITADANLTNASLNISENITSNITPNVTEVVEENITENITQNITNITENITSNLTFNLTNVSLNISENITVNITKNITEGNFSISVDKEVYELGDTVFISTHPEEASSSISIIDPNGDITVIDGLNFTPYLDGN